MISPDDDLIELWAYDRLCLFSKLIESYHPRNDFWQTDGDLENIDPTLAIIIADFGLGSDSPIVLDYRGSPTEPAVLRLAWELEHPPAGDQCLVRTRWVQCAQTFDHFVDLSGLATAAPLRWLD